MKSSRATSILLPGLVVMAALVWMVPFLQRAAMQEAAAALYEGTLTATSTMTATPTATPTATSDPSLLQVASPTAPTIELVPTQAAPIQDGALPGMPVMLPSASLSAPLSEPAPVIMQDPAPAATLDPTVAAALPPGADLAIQPAPIPALGDSGSLASPQAAASPAPDPLLPPTGEPVPVILTLDPTVAAVIPDAVMTMVAATQMPVIPTPDAVVAEPVPASTELTALPITDPTPPVIETPIDPVLPGPTTVLEQTLPIPAEVVAPTLEATTLPAVPAENLIPEAAPAPTQDPAAAVSVSADAAARIQNAVTGTITTDSRGPAFVILTDAIGQVTATAIIAQDGSFALPDVPPGSYTLTIDDGVSLLVQQPVSQQGGVIQVAPITLYWGDFNRDGKIDELDVVTVAAHYGQPAPQSLALLDITGDGLVGLGELMTVAANFGLSR
jgi:hypothetical protein